MFLGICFGFWPGNTMPTLSDSQGSRRCLPRALWTRREWRPLDTMVWCRPRLLLWNLMLLEKELTWFTGRALPGNRPSLLFEFPWQEDTGGPFDHWSEFSTDTVTDGTWRPWLWEGHVPSWSHSRRLWPLKEVARHLRRRSNLFEESKSNKVNESWWLYWFTLFLMIELFLEERMCAYLSMSGQD